MSQRAFTLREDQKESFVAGAATYGGEGRSVDVGALLEAGGGTIVTEDSAEGGQIADALKGFPALKEVTAGSVDDDVPVVTQDLKGRVEEVEQVDRTLTVSELREIADAEGVDLPDNAKKDDIAAAIDAARGGEAR